MVNKKFWLGILAMALLFAMTVVSCNDDDSEKESKPETDPALEGAWVTMVNRGGTFTWVTNGVLTVIDDEIEIKFNNGDIEAYNYETFYKYGNYTTTREGSITITYTHYYGKDVYPPLTPGKWYSKDNIIPGQRLDEKTINEMFSPHTYNYYITETSAGVILTIGEDLFWKASND